jgi:predicted KAP-like P-loop ATPase
MEYSNDEFRAQHNDSFSSLAETIAKLVASSPEDRSMIIGLHGPWGSGKSTLLNLVMLEAEKYGVREDNLIRINAWHLISDDITYGFFNELANELSIVIDSVTSELIREYAKIISGAGKLSEKILNASSRIISVLGLIGIGSLSFIESNMTKTLVLGITIAINIAGPILFGTAWALRFTAKLLQSLPSKDVSPVKLKKNVNNRLSEIQEPFLIAIDDMDRVEPQKVRELLLEIKENAQFANLAYLIAIDERWANYSLGNRDEEIGSEFLNKIFTLTVEVTPSMH